MLQQRLFLVIFLVLLGSSAQSGDRELGLKTHLFYLNCSTLPTKTDICVLGSPIDASLDFDFFAADESGSVHTVLEDLVAVENGDQIRHSMDTGRFRVSHEFHLKAMSDAEYVVDVKVGVYDDQGNSSSSETQTRLSVDGVSRYIHFGRIFTNTGNSDKPVVEVMFIGLETL
ncbi:MAG: hypothetical protein AAGB19_12450 [Cyanobacteria bacterium P01_F01_bin.3]